VSRGLSRTFLLVSLFGKGKRSPTTHKRRTRQSASKSPIPFSFWWIAFGEDGWARGHGEVDDEGLPHHVPQTQETLNPSFFDLSRRET